MTMKDELWVMLYQTANLWNFS